MYWPIGVAVFCAVVALIAFVVVRFRSDSDDLPQGRDAAPVVEKLYVAGLVGIAAFLLYLTYSTMSDIEPATAPGEAAEAAAPADALPVEVTAARWNWRFEYPQQGISRAATAAGPPTLVVPERTPVHFTLTSIDVIHSFWIPELRFKRDAFPRRETEFVLTFEDRGFHQGAGACSEYCGLRHSYMQFNVDVKSRADFDAWAADAGETPR